MFADALSWDRVSIDFARSAANILPLDRSLPKHLWKIIVAVLEDQEQFDLPPAAVTSQRMVDANTKFSDLLAEQRHLAAVMAFLWELCPEFNEQLAPQKQSNNDNTVGSNNYSNID